MRRKLDTNTAPRKRHRRTEEGGIKVEPYAPRACKRHTRRESTVSDGGVPMCDECFADAHPPLVRGPRTPLPENPAHASYTVARLDYVQVSERAEKVRRSWRKEDGDE